MKKIIAGKVYDTDKAKKIGCDWNGLERSDDKFFCETLYVKKTGEYFLHGEGGVLSSYSDGNSGSEVIKPLSYNIAKSWAEEKLSLEKFDCEFKILENDDEKRKRTVFLTDIAYKKLKWHANKNNKNVSQALEGLILENL